MARQSFYRPTDRGEEARISERMARWAALRGKHR
jgi:putative ATPase